MRILKVFICVREWKFLHKQSTADLWDFPHFCALPEFNYEPTVEKMRITKKYAFLIIKTNLELLGDLVIEFLGDLPERPDLGFECPGIGLEGVRSGWAPWLCSQQYSKGYDFEDSAPSTPLKISWFRS